jgi:hypothetical protein
MMDHINRQSRPCTTFLCRLLLLAGLMSAAAGCEDAAGSCGKCGPSFICTETGEGAEGEISYGYTPQQVAERAAGEWHGIYPRGAVVGQVELSVSVSPDAEKAGIGTFDLTAIHDDSSGTEDATDACARVVIPSEVTVVSSDARVALDTNEVVARGVHLLGSEPTTDVFGQVYIEELLTIEDRPVYVQLVFGASGDLWMSVHERGDTAEYVRIGGRML